MFAVDTMKAGLATEIFGRDLHCFGSIDSTNDYAMKMAREGVPEGTLIVADSQSRGKGRQGRCWVSPPGCNLYFSAVLRPMLAPAALPQITLMAAVSLCETLRVTTDLAVQIKWPNDLWIGAGKVGGILTEMSVRGDEVLFVVLGIGLNVNLSMEEVPTELRDTATSLLCEAGRRFDRASLLQRLLVSLDRDYLLYRREGFEPFRDRFSDLSLTLGKQVCLEVTGRRVEGRATGIDREGMLLVATGGGESIRVTSGEISFSSVDLVEKVDRRLFFDEGDG